MSAFLCRGLILALGYAYPAYQCYKTLKFSKSLELKGKAAESNSKTVVLDEETVELHRAEMEKLRLWCQYWVLVALVAVLERFADVFIAWLPCYHEAKLGFYLYLFYPARGGTIRFYEDYFSPYIGQYENEIDENLNDLKPKAKDLLCDYSKKAFEQLRPILSKGFNGVVYYQYQLSQLPQEQKMRPRLLSAMLPALPAAPQQHSQETSVPPDPIKKKSQEEEEEETSVQSDPIKREPEEQKEKETKTGSYQTAKNVVTSPNDVAGSA